MDHIRLYLEYTVTWQAKKSPSPLFMKTQCSLSYWQVLAIDPYLTSDKNNPPQPT
jgi:hypothetical protein